jgi:predicted PurR-regulated permease PerM
MLDEIRNNYSLVKVLIILLIIAVGSYVVSLLWIILSQFLSLFVILLLAWLFSLILEPIVKKIQELKVSILMATIITYILVSALLIVISLSYIPLVISQISAITTFIPLYLQSAPPFIVDFANSLGFQLGKSITLIPSVGQFLFLSFITLILSFYFVVDQEKINQEFLNLIPGRWHDFITFTQKTVNEIFISFLRVQLFYAVSAGILTWIVLMAFNIDFAASIALISGVFAFIPLIGPFLALVPPVLIVFLIDPIKALIIGAILLATQQVIFNIIGPKLLGKAFQLHPALILISFLLGLQFAGAIGAVFAIPILGIGAVMVRRFGHYFNLKKETTV